MTESLFNTLVALSGLGIGVAFIIITYFINKRIGKKNRWFDERQQKIRNQAKASSWNITLVVFLIAWAVVIVYEGISFSFFLIAILYVLHCLSLMVTSVYFARRN
ncbi:DUF2178 domain-containing protein [Halobacillus massiliensis]|uniref:DUF2178 domain-containing protein n=1 Tax=Halobacillus massiliensis TaxID=1926286 RepID=UPI0009E51E7D|nr:DUF2178 domain-containing protein [Halobacillus massiliensis]